jgi:hypothetical protein
MRFIAEDEKRNDLRNVDFFTAQPFDTADSRRKLHKFSLIVWGKSLNVNLILIFKIKA